MNQSAKSKLVSIVGAALVAGASFAAHAQYYESTWDPSYLKMFQTLKVMKSMDTDSDHKVTREEFNTYNAKMFDALDTNHDGVLDEKEWMKPLTAKK